MFFLGAFPNAAHKKSGNIAIATLPLRII